MTTWKKRKLALHWQIIIGLVLGVVYAIFSAKFGWSEFTADWIAPWGKIFINILKLIAIPMVLFSIIGGIVALGDATKLGRMGIKTLGLYVLTTVFACGIGLLVVNIMQPGKSSDEVSQMKNRIHYELWVEETPDVKILDGKNILNDPQYADLVAEVKAERGDSTSDVNVAEASIQGKIDSHKEVKEAGPLQFVVDMVPDNLFVSLGNNKLMLQVIFFAIFFGITLLMIPKERAKPVIDVVNGCGDAFVKMVDIVMKGAPFFVFALLAGTISKLAGDNPEEVLNIFSRLSFYSIAVVVGLFLMILLIYPTLVRLITKMPIPKFMRGILPAQMMAFSTSSSVATLPVTIECTEENLGVDKKVTSFVLPIGATVNMDGTSLYQAVAVVFLAQMHDVDLSLLQQFTIVLTATLASIGAAAVPSAGLVLMMAVLESVGLNPAWIAIIFPVDRILDMVRTAVNVTGDATVSSIIAKTEGQLHEETTGEAI